MQLFLMELSLEFVVSIAIQWSELKVFNDFYQPKTSFSSRPSCRQHSNPYAITPFNDTIWKIPQFTIVRSLLAILAFLYLIQSSSRNIQSQPSKQYDQSISITKFKYHTSNPFLSSTDFITTNSRILSCPNLKINKLFQLRNMNKRDRTKCMMVIL